MTTAKQLKILTPILTFVVGLQCVLHLTGCVTAPSTSTVTQSTNAAGTVIQVTNIVPGATTIDTNQLLGGIDLATQVAVDEAYTVDATITPYLELATNAINLAIASGNVNSATLIAQLNTITVNGVTNKQYTIAITGAVKAYVNFAGALVNNGIANASPLLVQGLQHVRDTIAAEILANAPAVEPTPAIATPPPAPTKSP